MMYKRTSLHKAENPAAYAKLASQGTLLGYPVKIQGQTHRPDNNIPYHSSIKFFDPKDHPHAIHQIAQGLSLNPPDAKNTQIEPGQVKDRLGNDVFILKLTGNSAEKLKEHHSKFSHMGNPDNYVYEAHISIPKAVHDKIKSSGAKTAHEAGIEFGPAELRQGSKILKTYRHEPDTTEPKVPDQGDLVAKVGKSEEVLGSKPLMKPYVSLAQERWAHTSSGKKALGGNAGVHEWDEATKGKKLPEKISKSESNYDALLEKLSEIEHDQWIEWSKSVAPEVSKERKDRWEKCWIPYGDLPEEVKEQDRKYSRKVLEAVNGKEKSLEKSAIKNAGIALGMAGALAGAPHTVDAGNKLPSNISHSKHKAPQYDHNKMLRAIAQVESSGGKNIKHEAGGGPIHGDEHAFGSYGIMPETIRQTINAHKDLKNKHGKALALRGQQLHNYMKDHKGLEDVIADRHLSHMEHVLGKDPSHLGYGWLQGIQGTLNAKRSGRDIKGHWHAQKVKQAYDKGK